MKRREGELGFGLDPARRQDVHIPSTLPRIEQQRGFSDAWLSTQHERSAS
jgi:hypothetical protein